MVLAPDQLLHLGPDPAGATWNHFDLGLGLSSHTNYPQAQLKNSPPQGQPWFYSKTNVSGKDVAVFSAPLGGATTSTNTQYARCELREYERDGTTKMAFDPRSGDHWIEGIYRIYGLSGLDKPGVCVQQAHDPNDDVIMVRTELSGGVPKLQLRYNDVLQTTLNSNYVDGTEFYLKIRVINGTPEIYYTTNLASIPGTPTHTSSGHFSSANTGWYFKTGSYNQTNESTDPNVDPDASIIRVEIRELKHWHSVTPKGGAWPTPATYATTGSPTVNAGADASISLGSAFSRTGTVTLNGATLTSQNWTIVNGPTGVGSTLSSAAAVSWTPTAVGIYELEFKAVTSAGTVADRVTVTVTTVTTPPDTDTAAGRLGWGTPTAVDEMSNSGAPLVANWSVYDGPGHAGYGIRNPARVAVNGSIMTLTGVAGSADTAGLAHKFEQKYGKWEVRARSQSTGGGTGFTAQVFVSTSGSDSNSGRSASSPKRTIAAGLSVANPGETISVADGTYTGNFISTKGGSSGGGYITIRAANKWGARLVGNGSTSNQAVVELNHQYLRIQDLEITGPGGEGSGARHGVYTAANNQQIIGCHIFTICKWSTGGTGWQGGAGIQTGQANTSNLLIDSNVIHDIGTAPGDDQLVHGMYIDSHVTGTFVQNNVIYDCEDFGLHPYDATEASGWYFINNTIYDCGRGILQAPNGVTRNNIVHNVRGAHYDIRGSGNTGSNNRYSGTGSGATGASIGATSISSPGFVNAAGGDFHLTSSSVLINAGTSTNAPSTDADGATRPAGGSYDIGAYEYGAVAGGGGGGSAVYRPVVLLWPDDDNPAFDWPYGAEYDFWELGGPDRTAAGAFMHFPSLDGSDSQREFTKAGVNSNDWHNYAIEWTPTELVGYIDGVEWFRTSGGATSARRAIQDAPGPMHLCLQFDPTAGSGLQAGIMQVDWIRVYPQTPIDGGGGTPGGGGGTSIGTYPSFVSVGSAVAVDDGSNTMSVPAPPGVQNGHFQVCIMECATSAETITNVPSGWQLLDEQTITNVEGGDTGDTSVAWVYYNTTGDTTSRSWTKSGTRGFHAVRMAWKDFSALGQHLVRVSSNTLTPYATPVTPGTDKAIAITILCSDRLNTTAGPVNTPNGWTQRYNAGPVVNGDEYEWISVAEIQVDGRATAGANVPSGSGLGTSNFTLTNADRCQAFSFILEGAVSTGTAFSGSVSLVVQKSLVAGLFLPPVGANAIILTAIPLISFQPLLRASISFWITPTLVINTAVFPRGALIIVPTLTFTTKQVGFAGLLLQAVVLLRAGALPYRRPTIRTDYKYPPLDHPFRLIAQRILDGEIVEWELPVSEDFEYTDQLSGPTIMQGSIRPEQIAVQELGLDGYAYWLHVEINQEIRASAILLPLQYEESAMTFSAEGVAAVPHYTTYDSVFSQIQVDPLSIVRTLWNYVQSQPQSDYGVVVSPNSSPVRIGTPATTQAYNDRTEAASLISRRMQSADPIFSDWTWDGAPDIVGTYNDELLRLFRASNSGDAHTWLDSFVNDHRAKDAEPYELNWWDAKNIGEEIDALSGSTPFDYIERHKWNADRTDVLHYVDLGYPRLGVSRPNLLFNEENIIEIVPIQEPEDSYASAVLIIGAGDGADTIRAYRAASFGDRVRKQVVITDKSITNQQMANARAEQELAFRRGRAFEAGEIVVNAYHTNAPIGSYQVGDDIQVQVEVPWLMVLHTAWYRITSIQNKPSSDKVRLGLARSSTLLDTSDIWIQPDDYVPFEPPPPTGALNWAGLVHFSVVATLTVVPPVPIPTANVVLVLNTSLTADGIAYGGSFAFISFYADYTLTLGIKGTTFALVNLGVQPSITATGIATGANSGTVTLTIPTSLIVTSEALPGAVSMSAVPTLTAIGSVPAAGSTTLSATPSLTVGAKLTAFGAVSLGASTTLSANGTVSSGTTVTQLGKTDDGTSSSSSSANKTVVSKATASVSGAVTAGHARLWVDSGTASVKMCIYSDSSGSPNSLLGLSDAITLTNTAEALKDFTFTGAQQASITPGTDYWIGFTWADPGTNNIFWSRGGTAGQAQQNSLNAAASFGTPGTVLTGPIDAYVDVTSSGGGGGGGGPQVDASTPAMMQNAAASTLTSAAFNAPANSLIVVCVHTDGAWNTHSVSNNGAALSWTTIGIQRRATTGTGSCAAFVAPCPTARSGLTVTWDSGTGTDDVGVKVYVLTNADLADPVGGKTQGASTSNTLTTTAFTTEKADSLCFVVADDFSTSGTTTASGLDAFFNYDVTGRIAGGSGYKRTGAAGSSVTLSMDAAGTATADWNWIAFEIRGA